jgi:superfamily II DNA or RNA helicase
MIRRFSSRSARLDHLFLRERLRGARRYHRIAGYFRSSLLELIHEELETIDEVRVVCNSDLDPRDLGVARTVHEQGLALKERWNDRAAEEGLLGRERYQRLYDLLVRGNLQVRVVGRNVMAFLHGKAGVIESRDGRATAFIGSNNETREGWSDHYELLWEDDSPEAIAWVNEEFDYLWTQGVPLPQAIIDEVDRCARRVEYDGVEQVPTADLPAAAMAEAPIHARGEQLMPWQRAFVEIVQEHRDQYGSARLLLADEVGVGKTLSLATSAVVACLLGDGPALILCPATLTEQWQTEFWDKLGVPSAVWTSRKTWRDHTGHEIRTRGAEDVARCPYQIGIVSTGLIVYGGPERNHLLSRKYGTLILDEAHRARRKRELDGSAGESNNLLQFMMEAAPRSRHVLLGSATPIQTDTRELWDLLEVLNQGATHVLGRPGSVWRQPDRALELVTGRVTGDEDEGDAWSLLRNPLAAAREDALFDHIRIDLEIPSTAHFTDRGRFDLSDDTQAELKDRVESRREGLTFFQRHNPIVRHTVLRKRATLEDRGLLPRIAVDIHPSERDQLALFSGYALLTSRLIDAAYEAAERFTALLGQRKRGTALLRNLLLQRICSSLAAGLETANQLLGKPRDSSDDEFDEDELPRDLTDHERTELRHVIAALAERPADPKLDAVVHYLLREGWLELGCIIFSQYYDTTSWIADRLAERLPEEPIAVYAGAGRSRLLRSGQRTHVERATIKRAVRERTVRLVVATDAACEGLNLQTLGTLINVDLPWNPSRLQQRIGRIQRIGQARTSVDMLNLVYQGTRDERVYDRISQRMRDRYDVLGGLPDVIEDDWIDDIATLDAKLDELIERRTRANAFDLRYAGTVDPKGEPWDRCAKVLSRRDIVERLSRSW